MEQLGLEKIFHSSIDLTQTDCDGRCIKKKVMNRMYKYTWRLWKRTRRYIIEIAHDSSIIENYNLMKKKSHWRHYQHILLWFYEI